jgi:XTP/dITP diphosphohydrolase
VVDVAFVTTNRGKFREAEAILRPYGVRLRWVRRSLLEPQADALEAVAVAKARSVRGPRGWVLVEDSGLFVPSLAGFPGVYSAHFLRVWGFPPLLRLLRGRPRGAYFRSVAALRRGSRVRTFVGEVRGSIAARASGAGGFGYDPIFVPYGFRHTFAQLPQAEKSRLSHRGRSMEQVGRYLQRIAPRRLGRRPHHRST